MKTITSAICALLMIALASSCDRKGVYYPDVDPEPDPSTLVSSVTLPVDWSAYAEEMPLLTSSHLYIYDEDGIFITKEVAAFGKNFEFELEPGKTYNFFISDNLLTAQQEENSLLLENIDDFYNVNFVGAPYAGDLPLQSAQGSIQPFAYATIMSYTAPAEGGSTTIEQQVKPAIGSAKVHVNISDGDYIELSDAYTPDAVDKYITTDEEGNTVVTEQFIEDFNNGTLDIDEMGSKMMAEEEGPTNISIMLNNMRGNMSLQRPAYSNLPVDVVVGPNNYTTSIISPEEFYVDVYVDSDHMTWYYIEYSMTTSMSFYTFGWIGDRMALPAETMLTMRVSSEYYNESMDFEIIPIEEVTGNERNQFFSYTLEVDALGQPHYILEMAQRYVE